MHKIFKAGLPIFAALLAAFCGSTGCSKRTLAIRLPDDNPAWHEVGAAVDQATSVLRQLEKNPDSVTITYGQNTEQGGTASRNKAAEKAF